MEEHKKYHYKVTWLEKEEAFVARVTEFPSLKATGKTNQEALETLENLVFKSVEELKEQGEVPPEPTQEVKKKNWFRRLFLFGTSGGILGFLIAIIIALGAIASAVAAVASVVLGGLLSAFSGTFK